MKRRLFGAVWTLAVMLSGAIDLGFAQEIYYTLRIGDSRPALNIRLLEGGTAPSWPALEGKVIVIDFWATWCQPCVGAIPKFNQLQKRFAKEPVVFLSVTYEPPSYVRRFLLTHPLDTTIAIDDDLRTFKSFRAWGIPTVYVFDRRGTVVSVNHPNDLSEDLILSVLKGERPQVPQYHGWEKPEEAEQYFRKLLNELRLKEKNAGLQAGR
jgi:thiol-disulfide isomerase/thioredoxin